jgi:hypothetical protein
MSALYEDADDAFVARHRSFDAVDTSFGADMADPDTPDVSFMRAPQAPRVSRSPLRLDALIALIALQRADGSWELDGAFAKAVGKRLATLEKSLAGATGDEQAARRALATAVAIAWLERHAADAQDEWRMLARKATDWLQSCGATPAGSTTWTGWIALAQSLI